MRLPGRLRAALKQSPPLPPAVVVGGGLNALGVVRSLGQAGVPVWLLAGAANMPAARSRYVEAIIYDDHESSAVVDALAELAVRKPGPRRPLILTEEEKVAEISAQRARLESDYHLMLPSADIVTRLLHKEGFRKAAEAGGLAIPRSCRIRSSTDLAKIRKLIAPLIIKPAARQAAYLSTFKRAYRAEDHDQAEALLVEMLTASDDLIVQEWIDGDDSSIYFCLQFVPAQGQTPVSFVGRKLRSWPPETGGTACCIAAPEAADDLTEPTTAFFRSQGVVGFASMEYKWRSATGEYVMIEPTIGRTDHQEEVATLNGVNLPLAGYCWAIGRSLPKTEAAQPMCVWRDRDAEANATASKPGMAHPAPASAHVIDALWRADDPAPSLYDLGHRIVTKLGRLTGRTQ
ncbi:hypothetical protein V5738_05770 [Salinisphaera sp. SPP-AMP-43]|uniref:carboxylate--amine ligase n=1 Tax=Salinisphaera sp. SPP-AMP-43 TaxID=3121288 RepID=UPI003C6DCA32